MAELRSTIEDLRRFTFSNIWRDLSSEMTAWKEDIRDQLEICTEPQTLSRLQGNAEAVNRFLELPTSLIEILEVDAQATEMRSRIAE
jgi:hypothetical protein